MEVELSRHDDRAVMVWVFSLLKEIGAIQNSMLQYLGISRVTSKIKTLARFFQRQAREIQEGGFRVLLRKGISLVKKAAFLVAPVPLSPVVLLVRALRPVVLVRFGPLDSDRIGGFSGNAELYLCQRDAGIHDSRTFDIFYHRTPVCNQQLKRMIDRALHVSSLAQWLDRGNRMLPGGEKHVIPRLMFLKSPNLFAQTQAHLSFTLEEERLGRAALRELGIPEGTPFICFHSRDSAYLNTIRPDSDWRYHNYRDSSIHNYVPAAKEMARRGYFAIRMGAAVSEGRLNTTDTRIINYAVNGRNDFLDIFLSGNCRFFIGDTAGINTLPLIFRVPRVWVNRIPLEEGLIGGAKDLFIPKKLWLRKEHRFLTFREMLEFGVVRFYRSEQYEQIEVEPVENAAEEITALTIEMDERLKGTWQTTEEDEELQRRFWSLFRSSELHGTIVSRIGAEFLRQNRNLLD